MNGYDYGVIVVIIVIALAGLMALSYAEESSLDIQIKHHSQTAFKQNEFTVSLQSCDESQKICYYKNRLSYVPITIDVHKIIDDQLLHVETIYDDTGKSGVLAVPIKMDHEYEPRYQYMVTITGEGDQEVIYFWLTEKQY